MRQNSENNEKLKSFSKIPSFVQQKKWEKLDPNVKHSQSIDIFKNNLLKFIYNPNQLRISHPKRIKLITKLRFGLSHSSEHNFNHCAYCLTLFAFKGHETETTTHYLLPYPSYENEIMTLLGKIRSISSIILKHNGTIMTKIFSSKTPLLIKREYSYFKSNG